MASLAITPADIIAALNKWLATNYKTVKSIVFDPMAGYETSIENVRATSIQLNNYREPKSTMPILSWNRTPFRRGDMGKTISQKMKGADGKWYNVTVAMMKMDYRFVFFATNMKDVEQFEVDWLTQRGLNGITNATVNMGQSLGEFTFALNWGMSLEDITFNLETNYYKALTGSAEISGPVISATELGEDDLNNLIEVVEFRLQSCNGGVLPDKFTITDLGD